METSALCWSAASLTRKLKCFRILSFIRMQELHQNIANVFSNLMFVAFIQCRTGL